MRFLRRLPRARTLGTGALAGALAATPLAGAAAVQPAQSVVVSATPAAWTPHAANGVVNAFAQVGGTVVAGGSFTSVSQTRTSAAVPRTRIFAFNATTGALSTSFAPTLDGVVSALLPGPDGNSVYVSGSFNTVNGVAVKKLALLNLSTGALVPTFKTPNIVGSEVSDLAVSGGRLFVAGKFTTVAGAAHAGLATLSPTTGKIDPYLSVQLAGHHNYTGNGGANAPVGASKIDIAPNGARMVVVGNFKTANGLDRDQIAVLNLAGTASVAADWQSDRYKPACYANAFDSYIRDVDFSPDGRYFVTVATGGGNGTGTLCDAAARWETAASGTGLQPTWVDYTGGDSLWSVAVTGTAVYVGGHQRWMNNPYGVDNARSGAVPRPGLAALDPANGLPLSWNPARNPRGAGAYALLATPAGLWVGSDTTWIGNRAAYRGRIAFFPVAGGKTLPANATAQLPGTVYSLGALSSAASSRYLYRVNAAGPALQSGDDGPDWSGDGASSPYRTGGNAASYSPVAAVSSSVPAGTPRAVFDTERWSNSTWAFPVPAGTQLAVRLYFANRYSGTSQPGQRVFDVDIDGVKKLDDYDIVADTGDQTGTMKSFPITSDGTVDIAFSTKVEQPLINAIEIVRTDLPAGTGASADAASSRPYDGTTAGPAAALPDAGIAWSKVRGAVLVDGTLYYGWSDGTFHKRAFDGTTFGADAVLDPYNDAKWSSVLTGSGPSGQTYRGIVPDLFGGLSNVTGMVYSGGRLYYTLFGDAALHYRGFTPESGVVEGREAGTAAGVDLSDVAGMFLSGNRLYYASRATGNLWAVGFGTAGPTGTASVVDTSTDWRAHALFLR